MSIPKQAKANAAAIWDRAMLYREVVDTTAPSEPWAVFNQRANFGYRSESEEEWRVGAREKE